MTLDEARAILCDMLIEDDQSVDQLREMTGGRFTCDELEALAVWQEEEPAG